VLLGLAGVATMPAAVEVAYRSARITLLEAAYAVPIAFALGVLAAGMARRAKRNRRGTGVASTGVILGVLAISLALMAALSVGFYEAVEYYHRH
jgi:hypothetical protein